MHTDSYYDANATTPVDPRVADLVMHYMVEEFGNAGSRTHAYGARASQAVERARAQLMEVLGSDAYRIVFTSGATESNNIAVLGLAPWAKSQGRNHIVASAIEHKAVLEPIELLQAQGFDVDLVNAEENGAVSAEAVLRRVRSDTALVSVMHVNNETGVIQPVSELAGALASTSTVFHVDAAQGFGKDLVGLRHQGTDLISISGHKIYGPKGIGALAINEASQKHFRLEPLFRGGGQEYGLRPGTQPVPLIAGLGLASELAVAEHEGRTQALRSTRQEVLTAAVKAGGVINGDQDNTVGNVLNISFPGVDSESAIVLLQDTIAISNGAACSSASYTYSHVLQAMGLPEERVTSALRISWWHDSAPVDWNDVFSRVKMLV